MERTLAASAAESRAGALLMLAAAVVWSFGGSFGRLLGDGVEPWAIVFWRSLWAGAFLFAFMLVRDGGRGTVALFRAMGRPGLAVALLFGSSSTTFVLALQHTTVANILLVQAGAPLIAALLAWAVFGERVAGPTWAAIAAVLCGIAIMVSDSLAGTRSFLGDALALWIVLGFSLTIVIVRRFAALRMVPAVCLGTLLAAGLAATQAASLAVRPDQMAVLFGFGALNLGLGLALFVTGARQVPAAVAALLSVAESMLGPLWVFAFFGEVPAVRTLLGGGVVLGALTAHIAWQMRPAQRA
jgi:drug/metabolite transporter (DMT)-like permease